MPLNVCHLVIGYATYLTKVNVTVTQLASSFSDSFIRGAVVIMATTTCFALCLTTCKLSFVAASYLCHMILVSNLIGHVGIPPWPINCYTECSDGTSDFRSPEASSCFCILFLPLYDIEICSKEDFFARFDKALTLGRFGFG